ncbi:MAG TPA: hypothetical protein VLE89_08240 [Chlamydiales bacterium]|nr:hypothetical protein [Chlamydiales bacterium]
METNNSVQPTPSVANPPPQPKVKKADPISFSSDASGMFEVMTAMMASIEAIQNYDSNGLMPISESLLERSQAWASYYINVMSNTSDPNSDMSQINSDMAKYAGDPTQQATHVNADVTAFNLHNTLYNQGNTYFSGVTNGINQNSSDSTQTIQINLTNIQSGPLSQLQTITQAL